MLAVARAQSTGAGPLGIRGFGPHETVDATLNHRLPFLEAGQWGLFRVYAARVTRLLPLP
jgi:hypothetical protein